MVDKLIKYIVGGISNTIFSYFMYCILALLLNYKISYLLSILFSILYSYKINTKLVFNIDRKNIKKKIIFFLIIVLQISIGIYLLNIWIDNLSINKFLAPIINIILISPAVFLIGFYSTKEKLK